MSSTLRKLLVCSLFALWGLSQARLSYAQYEMVNIGSLTTAGDGSGSSEGMHLNAKGLVSGTFDLWINGYWKDKRAFIYDSVTESATNLGSLGDSTNGLGFSAPSSLNENGLVIGYSELYNGTVNFTYYPFLYDYKTNKMSNLVDKIGQTYLALGINKNGVVFGTYDYTVSGASLGRRAFVYDTVTDEFTNLGSLGTDRNGVGSSEARAINDQGMVVGVSNYYYLGIYKGTRAFLYDPKTKTMTNLGDIGVDKNGFTQASALAVNNNGQVIGNVVYRPGQSDTAKHGFLYDSSTGKMKDLGTLGAANTDVYAAALNDSGQVVGVTSNHAFFYDPASAKMTDIGTLGTDILGVGFSSATGINNKGQVVGYSDYYVNHVNKGSRAFLYDSSKGTLLNLGTLGTDIAGKGYSVARAINNNGQVLGTASYFVNGQDKGTRAFLYTAVKAKATILTLNARCSIGQGTTLKATLSTGGAAFANQPVTFYVDGIAIGSSISDSTGLASLFYNVPQNKKVGPHVLYATALGTETVHASISRPSNLQVFPGKTATTAISRSGRVGLPVLLSGFLRNSGIGLRDKTISFVVDGVAVGSALTNYNGLALLLYTIPDTLSSTTPTVTLQFAGDGDFFASSGSATLTVAKMDTNLAASDRSARVGRIIPFRARLRRADTLNLNGKTVEFKVNGTSIGTAVTDSTGFAILSAAVPATAGNYTITAEFAGDNAYLASSATATLTVTP